MTEQYCKVCKQDKNTLEFTLNSKVYKQCNVCREKRRNNEDKLLKQKRNKITKIK